MIVLIIRAILVSIYFLGACIVALFFCFLKPFDAKVTTYCGKIFGTGVIPLMGTKVDYRDLELLQEKEGPFIFIANHQDNYDTFIIGYTASDRTVSIGKKSIIYFPIFGIIYWMAGNILIDRSDPTKALQTMKEAGERMKKEKLKVLVLPEGTRSRGRGLLPFKKGAFHLAIQHQIPIVPLVVSSYSKKLNFKKVHSGDIIIKALPAIETTGMDKTNVTELRDKCYHLMKSEIAKLDQELEA